MSRESLLQPQDCLYVRVFCLQPIVPCRGYSLLPSHAKTAGEAKQGVPTSTSLFPAPITQLTGNRERGQGARRPTTCGYFPSFLDVNKSYPNPVRVVGDAVFPEPQVFLNGMLERAIAPSTRTMEGELTYD